MKDMEFDATKVEVKADELLTEAVFIAREINKEEEDGDLMFYCCGGRTIKTSQKTTI